MWQKIAFIAESQRFDAKALTDFALVHQNTYGIVINCGQPEVSNWHVDRLLADFKACSARAPLDAAGDTA